MEASESLPFEGKNLLISKTGKKVVYIEDETELIDLVRLILELRGLKVIGARTGQEGLETVRQVEPDLVLLDLMLPDIDGWEVYDQMRADDGLRDIPVIVVSVKMIAVDKSTGLYFRNVDGYITKPFKVKELVESVNGVIRNRGSVPKLQDDVSS